MCLNQRLAYFMSDFHVPKIEQAFRVTMVLPGSKSIALRQLAISALSNGCSTVLGLPACDDIDAMLDCLAALGVTLQGDYQKMVVTGPINTTDDIHLNARMSGASTRLLIGLASLRQGRTTIDGHSSLRTRTNTALLDVLRQHHCQVESDQGGLPLTIQGPIQASTDLFIDGSLSSQYITALMLIAPVIAQDGPLTIHITGELVSRPYIDITLHEMTKRGARAKWVGTQQLEIQPGSYSAGAVGVEGDATAATYFAALATLHGGTVQLDNLGTDTKQGDYGFIKVMQQLGAQVNHTATQTTIQGPRQLKPINNIDMTTMPDAALTLIGMGTQLPNGITITGLSTLQHKECNRLLCPAEQYQQMGVQVETTTDSICIPAVDAADIQTHTLATYHDHRMAMAFSTLGSITGRLGIDDPDVVGKTYPNYWQDFEKLANG